MNREEMRKYKVVKYEWVFYAWMSSGIISGVVGLVLGQLMK
jgi:hypothetical protein